MYMPTAPSPDGRAPIELVTVLPMTAFRAQRIPSANRVTAPAEYRALDGSMNPERPPSASGRDREYAVMRRAVARCGA